MSENNEKHMIVITLSKVSKKIKKYWWIILLTIILSVACFAAYESLNKEEKNVKTTQYNNALCNNLYGLQNSETMDRVELNLETDSSSTDVWNTTDIQTYQACTSMYIVWNDDYEKKMVELASLLPSNTFVSELQNKLASQGYDMLLNADCISVNINSNRMCTIVVTGGGNAERILATVQATQNILQEIAKEKFQAKDVHILDDAEVYEAIKFSDNSYYRLYSQNEKQTTINDLSGKINGKNILLISILGSCIGMCIVLLLVICDNRVYSEKDMDMDFPCLGKIVGKKRDDIEVISKSIAIKCKKEDIDKIYIDFTYKDVNDDLEDLLIALKGNMNGVECLYNENNNKLQKIRLMDECKGVIMLVKVEKDTVQEICARNKEIRLLEGNTLGYIMY